MIHLNAYRYPMYRKPSLKSASFIFLSMMLLASCSADPLYEYAKPGASKKQRDADRAECSNFAAVSVPAGTKLTPGERVIINQLKNQQLQQIASCMKAKGYKNVEID